MNIILSGTTSTGKTLLAQRLVRHSQNMRLIDCDQIFHQKTISALQRHHSYDILHKICGNSIFHVLNHDQHAPLTKTVVKQLEDLGIAHYLVEIRQNLNFKNLIHEVALEVLSLTLKTPHEQYLVDLGCCGMCLDYFPSEHFRKILITTDLMTLLRRLIQRNQVALEKGILDSQFINWRSPYLQLYEFSTSNIISAHSLDLSYKICKSDIVQSINFIYQNLPHYLHYYATSTTEFVEQILRLWKLDKVSDEAKSYYIVPRVQYDEVIFNYEINASLSQLKKLLSTT